jgi:hypothetical protein
VVLDVVLNPFAQRVDDHEGRRRVARWLVAHLGAVVTKSIVQPGAYAGNPARLLRAPS